MEKIMNHTKLYIQEFGSGSLLPVHEDRSRISIARRVGFVILLSLLVVAMGCQEDRLPTDPGGRIVPIPTPGPPTAGPPTAQGGPGIAGVVLGEQDRRCLVGATVELLDGPLAGHHQIQNDCGGHYMLGFRFVGLPPDMPVTVRASMPGYISKVQSITTIAETATPGGMYEDWAVTGIYLRKD
jgi:hypothetical protein